MNRSMLSPSMMCVSPWKNVENSLSELESSGVDLLHMDIMDGVFVPNLMMSTNSIKSLREAVKIPLDLHLMVEKPEEKLPWFDIQQGEYVSVHAESTRHLQRTLASIRSLGAHPVAALNPATPISMLEEVYPDVDMILLMTVNPGYAGQKLIPQTLDKIARLRQRLDAKGYNHIRIEVDGNVGFETINVMLEAGADTFVCGTSSVFLSTGTITENVKRLRKILNAGKTEE